MSMKEWRTKSSALERKFGSGSDYFKKHPDRIFADYLVIQIGCLLVIFWNSFYWAFKLGLSVVLSLVAALLITLLLLAFFFAFRNRLPGYKLLLEGMRTYRKRQKKIPIVDF